MTSAQSIDLSLKCSICKNTVSAFSLADHQRHHNALKVLKYKEGANGPADVDILLRRRRLIIKKLISKFKGNQNDLLRRINKVNESFDLVRSNLLRGRSVRNLLNLLIEKPSKNEGAIKIEDIDLKNDIQAQTLSHSDCQLPECVVAIGRCMAMNIETRNNMEDGIQIQPTFLSLSSNDNSKDQEQSCFIGVYGGYCGPSAAKQCCENFHQTLKQCIEKAKFTNISDNTKSVLENKILTNQTNNASLTNNEEDFENNSNESSDPNKNMLKCIRKSFKETDNQLKWGIGETSRLRWSGCSATTCIIQDENLDTSEFESGDYHNHLADKLQNGRIFLGNTGDVKAYIVHKNKPFPLTTVHNVKNQEEVNRIANKGGKIIGNMVNSLIETTRGLGNHGDPELKKLVISDPHTCTARINGDSQYVVIATRGLWSYLSIEEVSYIIKTTWKSYNYPSTFTNPVMTSFGRQFGVSNYVSDINTPETVDVVTRDLHSIIETEEEEGGIEEVVIVSGNHGDDDSTISESDALESTKSTMGAEDDTSKFAEIVCERIVRASVTAGATENISVVLVLFQGFVR